MQKFTRPLTREIDLGGERIALTLSEAGLAVRPVGSRKAPLEMSWARLLCAATHADGAETREPTAGELSAAVEAVKKGSVARPAAPPETAAPATPPAAAAQGSSSGGMPDLLARLEKWLRQHRPDMLEGLRPGAAPEELDAFQARLGCPVPASLRTLLAWHNGQKEDYLGRFEQDWRLLSSAEIEKAKSELEQDMPAEATGGAWQPAWLPVFDDDSGDYLCLDTSSASAPVRAYWVDQPDHPVTAPSLEAWFQDFVSAVEKGQYHEEPERGTFFRDSPP